MSARLDLFMPTTLLDSQLDTLEPLDSDERGILIDVARPPAEEAARKEKSRIRQLYAEGLADREQLLEAETASYHSAGTCTFYGTP
ncbi:hypothetical protein RCH22_003231 [Cryobacterium psychrotolerans]|nr:hypothetical protein [Cryobacterium psychrotolerans]